MFNENNAAIQKLGFITENYNKDWQISLLNENKIDKAFTTYQELFKYLRSGDEVYFASFLILEGTDIEKIRFIDDIKKFGAIYKSCAEPKVEDRTITGKLIQDLLIGASTFFNEIAKYKI
jgi:hypothetical protein